MKIDIKKNLQSIGTHYAGEYLVNRFFIKINTQTKKKDIPSYNYEQHTFADQDQITLQRKSEITLVHEHLHYIHEVSTMVGITQFYFEVICRSIFSDFVNLPANSGFQPVTGQHKVLFDGLRASNAAILGGAATLTDSRIVADIESITLIPYNAVVPFSTQKMPMKVPNVVYNYADKVTSKTDQDSVFFGKYYLYEGLAHQLDREIARQKGISVVPEHQVPPEYKFMRLVGKTLYPTISDRHMLETASLALSYINPGEMFIKMVKDLSDASDPTDLLTELKQQVSAYLATRLKGLEDTLNAIKHIFKKRLALSSAADYLCGVMLNAYKTRIDNPVFEVDYIYEGKVWELNQLVTICDFMYELDDEDTFMRDFGGSQLGEQLSNDLKTLLCNVDYYMTAINDNAEHCCPLFTCCPHRIRQDKPSQCERTPRLAFEDQSQYGWCHYGLGVAYMKGEDYN